MKHFLFVLTFLISATAFASDEDVPTDYYANKCVGKEDEIIRQLETELDNCEIDMPEEPTTADMNEATYRYADCSIEVADKLFDHFYKQSNEQVKKNFDDLVKALYAHSHDLSQHSDFAQDIHKGSMYNTEAIYEGAVFIRKAVRNFLHQVRVECGEKNKYGY